MPSEHHQPTLESLHEKYRRRKIVARKYLARGIIFLMLCLTVGQLLTLLHLFITNIMGESLVIIGWVAMWRPIEIYLYELPEIRQEIEHMKQTA
ncbi:hypothetical protein A3C89_04085 [Candidatus Kaiserbacteria bacterium RIFCSPHIGHO2_02_FULL_50_50]|uniref:2TM domain-containing protein n=1 Tax=Candidatus Kaiserbacteria bacterium RIFCSPHIGHO2_02_FULL_50_50 TaxID=1798492 RepID=A0A1F6DG45_9BACT|nr:MAG: hypothetical protein A3C89_04085 [Candidatus Kaiserbacteria bacterium RIFCSPHIGHO2_02_FULL_50_50]OGG88394.1 MAG: hypothetical protein A3G62_02225 [Candidatus Kaiserbacteria bacterium RIFCSPLOWO2_12_FULL_50_10]